MSGVQQRLKLKQTPIDTWSLKEHLTLASAVLKNGDQNWVSVSRTMKQLGEGGRPGDWFKDKNCALQYNLLLEKADIPTRKRGEKTDSNETPAQRIVNQLAQDRIAELKIILEKERVEILKLEEQTQMLSSEEEVTEEQLAAVMKEVEAEEAEEDAKEQQAVAWLQSREEKKQAIQAALKSGVHRARFGVKHPPGQLALSQSQSEQSGSELDSAVESPVLDTGDSDSQPVDVESVTPVVSQPHQSQTNSFSALETHVVTQSPAQSPTLATSPLLTSLLQSPTRPPGSTSPMKSAAISNLAQKLASPTPPFSSPVLPPALDTTDNSVESTLDKADDADLKETLFDLDELLKKELEESAKDEPAIEKEEVKVEPVPEVKEEVVETEVVPPVEVKEEVPEEPEKKVEETILEIVKAKEEKEEEVDESDNKTSKRVGRPRKTTEVFAPKAVTQTEEEISKCTKTKKEKEDGEKTKSSRPSSPKSRQASPSPEVAAPRSLSRERPTKKAVPEVPEVEESAPATPEPTEEEKEHLAWKKSVLGVLGRIMQHKHAHHFTAPVSEVVAPDYRDMVYRPMDLGSIKTNIESGHINNTEGMLRDIHLMLLNAIMYSSSDSEIFARTVVMQTDTYKLLNDFTSSQSQTESPLAVPSRPRGRSVSGTGTESPVSSRSRTVSSSAGVEDRRKRERTHSVAEEGVAKKRRLRTIDEN